MRRKQLRIKNRIPLGDPSNTTGRKNKSIEGKDKFLCPECGSQSLVKVKQEPSNTYIFKCKQCRAISHPLSTRTNYTRCI